MLAPSDVFEAIPDESLPIRKFQAMQTADLYLNFVLTMPLSPILPILH